VAEETALLDSGVRENFLDEDVWKGLGIGRVRLKQPIPVHNVDGTENAEEKNITAGCGSNQGNERRKCDFT